MLISVNPLKKMERLKGWKPEQIQAASNIDNIDAVVNFLTSLIDMPFFDRVHKMFKNCTCLHALDRTLTPIISSSLGKIFCWMLIQNFF